MSGICLSPTHPNNFDYYPIKDKVTEWLCTFEYNKPLAQTCHMVRVRDEQHSHAHTILYTLVRMYSFTVDLDLRGCHTELTLSWLLVTEISLLTSTGSSLTYHVNGHTSP